MNWNVEKIEKLFTLGRGRVINDEQIKNNPGDYPVYSSQTSNNGEFGRVNFYEFEGDYITWTTDGANAGKVFFREGKFNCTNVCGTLKAKDETLINTKFFAYLIDRYAFRHVAVVGNNKLMNNVMAKIKVHYPQDIHEQTAIATILSKVEKSLAATEDSILVVEKVKKALMQNLLTGKLKSDGAWRNENEFYLDEKFGKIPVGWKVKMVKDLCERRTEPFEPSKNKTIYKYVGLEHIEPEKFILNGVGKSDDTLSTKSKFLAGDILYGKLRPYLNKLVKVDFDGVCSTECLVLVSKENADWVYLNLQQKRYLNFTQSITAGTQHPRASWRDISRYLIAVPEDEAEKDFIIQQILKLEEISLSRYSKIQMLQRLKKSLMQNLLTGKVRLNADVISKILNNERLELMEDAAL